MIDAHCHLQFEQFDKDREDVIGEVKEKLDLTVIAGIGLEDNEKAKEVADSCEKIIYCMGAHPVYDHENLKQIKYQIRDNEVAAVGEIGLDYNYITDEDEREKTEKVFREMIELAESEDLNVVVHSRNAERTCFEIVNEYDVTGFFHCFNGRPELASEIIEEGHLIGVTGQVMHSTRVQNIVEDVPVEGLLTETDSPYLGEKDRNTPLYVQEVTKKIAEIKGVNVEDIEASVESNVENFFRY
jgi:TatD DNase family protein